VTAPKWVKRKDAWHLRVSPCLPIAEVWPDGRAWVWSVGDLHSTVAEGGGDTKEAAMQCAAMELADYLEENAVHVRRHLETKWGIK
jgi:hypothetical protein